MDRETIINGLEIILNGCNGIKCEDCVFRIKEPAKPARCGLDEEQIEEAAIALLKEQEAVAVHDPGAYCPKCGWMLYPEDHPHHCGNCGQAVKWDG